MKPVPFLCLLLMLSAGSTAQNLKIKDHAGNYVTGDTVTVMYYPGPFHGWTELIVELRAENSGADTVEMAVRKREYSVQADEYHSFCFGGMCFLNNTFVSPITTVVAGGATDSTFSGHFRFDDTLHIPHICRVSYTFFDVNNPSDSAIVYVNYNTLLQSGVEEQAAQVFLSEVWPNPSAGKIKCTYRFSEGTGGYYRVYDYSGTCIETQRLEGSEGIFMYNGEALPPGIYFLSVYDGKGRPATRKFIVSHPS